MYRRTPAPLPDLPHISMGGNSDGAVEITSWRPNAVPHASFVIHQDVLVAASLRALDAPVLAAVTNGNTPSERRLAALGFTPVPS